MADDHPDAIMAQNTERALVENDGTNEELADEHDHECRGSSEQERKRMRYYQKMGVSTWITRTLSLKPCFTVFVMFSAMIYLTYMAIEMELLVPALISE